MAATTESAPAPEPAATTVPNPLASMRIATRIPGADYAFHAASALYTLGKLHSSTVPFVNELITSTEQTIVDVAQPLLEKHSTTIESLDEFACGKMDELEATISGVKSSVLKKSTELVQTSVINPLEAAVVPAVRFGATMADVAVDTFLPPQDDDEDTEEDTRTGEEDSETTPANDDESDGNDSGQSTGDAMLTAPQLTNAVVLCRGVVSKAKLRAYKMSLKQIETAQARAAGTIEMMKPFTVDLIAYAKTVLDDPASAAREAPDVFRARAAEATGVATATAEYITSQRALFREALGQHADAAVQHAMAHVGPVKDFVRDRLEASTTYAHYVEVLQSYRLQAETIRSQLLANDDVSIILERIAHAYAAFEDVADPYTVSMLSAVRQWVQQAVGHGAAEGTTAVVENPLFDAGNDEDDDDEGEAVEMQELARTNVTNDVEDAVPIDDDDNDVGDNHGEDGLRLVLTRQQQGESAARRVVADDIDDESVLLAATQAPQ